jgi:hypothetical protein
MGDTNEEKDGDEGPAFPEGYTGPMQSYYSVSIGENLGFTFITSAEWDPDELDSFMRSSCDVVLQAHRHRLLIDALASGSMVKAQNLFIYSSTSKAEDFETDECKDDQDPKGYQ